MTPRTRRTVLAIRSSGPDGVPLVAVEVLAREANLHPDLVRRLISLGALEQHGGTSRAPLYPPDAAARLARVARLRHDLGLNYLGALLAVDLLARIEALESDLARTHVTSEVKSPWTSAD